MCVAIQSHHLRAQVAFSFARLSSSHWYSIEKGISLSREIILKNSVSYAMITLYLIPNGGMIMSVSYDKLWKLLIDKKMNRAELKDAAGISFNVVAKLGRNEFVSMESLQKICQTLSCNIGEIMDFVEGDHIESQKAEQILGESHSCSNP